MKILVDELDSTDVASLLLTHRAEAAEETPPESTHSLGIEELRKPQVTFWSLRDDHGQLLGCGALKELDALHAEVKSMHTARPHRGKGVANTLLKHMMAVARERGYQRLSLETGSNKPFAAARALYAKHGFIECDPFDQYQPDPYSTFMTVALNDNAPW